MEPKIKKPKVKAPSAKAIAGSLKKKFGILFFYCILAGLLGLVSSFIIAKNAPSQGSFISFQVFMLVLGIIHVLLMFHVLQVPRFTSVRSLLTTLVTMTCMAMLSLLNTKIPLFPDYPPYYTWGLIAFLIPLLAMVAFEFLNNIPQKIYSTWQYPYGKEVPVIEVIDPKKIKFYISLQQSDEEYNEFSLNVPMKYPIGEFLHYFMHRYNYDKNPQSPIFVSPDNTNENMYGWLFTTKAFLGKKVLDPRKTFAEQGIKENSTILIDRYSPPANISADQEDLTHEINELEHAQ